MKINVIGSGSSGNSILFDDELLIDAGLPFKHLEKYVDGISTVLLSHCHSDHINTICIRKMHVKKPSIKFCCGDFLEAKLLDLGLPKENIIIIKSGEKYKSGDFVFSPVTLNHDVKNFGYRLMKDSFKVFYATDTFDLNGITAMNYDVGLIEANHDLETALEIIEQKKEDGEFCHLSRAIKTHLDVNKAIKFIEENNIRKWIPVHLGNSTKEQVMKKITHFLVSLDQHQGETL